MKDDHRSTPFVVTIRNPVRQLQGHRAWLDYIALHAQWWLEQWAAHPETMPTTTPKAQVRLASAPRELKEFYSPE